MTASSFRPMPLRWPWLVLLCAMLGLLGACATLETVAGLLNNQLVLSAPQLQAQANRRFPRDYEKAGGLVTLTVLNPRISIPAGGNRLRMDFDIGFRGLGRDSSEPVGHFAVASGLRFDAGTRGLHLEQPGIEAIDIPKLGGAMNRTGRDLVNRWLQDYAREEPVYRIDDRVFSQLRPGQAVRSTLIRNGQVVVDFGP